MEPIKIIVELRIYSDGTSYASARAPNGPMQEVAIVPEKLPAVELVYELTCTRYTMKIGKKPAKSCKGCTVTCPAKNKYKGETITLPTKAFMDEMIDITKKLDKMS